MKDLSKEQLDEILKAILATGAGFELRRDGDVAEIIIKIRSDQQ